MEHPRNKWDILVYHSYCGLHSSSSSLIHINFNYDTVFWVVMPCSLVDEYQHFNGTYFFHPQGKTTHFRRTCLPDYTA
jgi:hypothetical protein